MGFTIFLIIVALVLMLADILKDYYYIDKETGDIYLVADVLGHSDVNTTRKHYAAMSEDRRRLAAKAVTLRDDDATEAFDSDQ